MSSDILKRIISSNGIAFAICQIFYNGKKEPIDFEIIEVNNLFTDIFSVEEDEVIHKKASSLDSSRSKNRFKWLSFFNLAFSSLGKEAYTFFADRKSTKYDVGTFALDNDKLFITIKPVVRENNYQNTFELLFDEMISGCAIYSIKNGGKTPYDCTVEAINKAGVALEKKPKSEIIGKTLGELRKNVDKTPVMDEIREVVSTGKTLKLAPFHYNFDGYDDYYENVMFRLSDNKVVIMYTDVTERELSNLKIKESKNELQSYIENAPSGIFVSDMLGRILKVNNQLVAISGYKQDEIIGSNLLEFLDESEMEKAKYDLFKKRSDKERFEAEYKCRVNNGQIKHWNVSTVKLDEEKFIGFVYDVTEKKILEGRITKSEREFRLLFDNAGAGIVYFGLDGKIMLMNKLLSNFIGVDANNVSGSSLYDVFTKTQADELMKRLELTIKSCESMDYEDKVKGKDDEIHVLSTYNCMYGRGGEITGIAVIFVDITELRKSQSALKESEERFKLLFNDAPLGYQSLNEEGELITANKAWLEMLGYSRDEVIGKSFAEFIPPEYVPVFKANFPKFKYEGATCVTFEMLKKSKEKIKVRIDGRISKNSDGTFKQTHCIVQDITAQLDAEQKLVVSEKRYSSMIENISDVILISDINRKIIYASPNFFHLFGWESEELIGKTYSDFIHPDDYNIYEENTIELEKNPGSIESMEFRVLCANGSYKYIHLVAKNLIQDKNINGILANFHDITNRVILEKEKRAMDAYVRNQQKLESIGTLASGVAHEINNPINGIMNYSQVILDSLEDSKQVKECANEIIHETSRVSEIVQNLLGFSRPNQLSFQDTEVKEVLESTLSLVRTTIRHDRIDLKIEIEDNLPNIRCRSSQIQQVIMNLVTNARDSLNVKYPGHDKNKKMNISAKSLLKKDKEHVRITIEDFGTGIPINVQNRIFDPFFTTKSRDQGTGLGLSISHGIVQEHNGRITFSTKEGQFTRFYLDLPIDN